MIFQILLLFFILSLIFLISQKIVSQNYLIIEKIFKNKKLSVWILAFLFLPGTVIHELSHFLIALILRVPTGPISIFPQINPTPNGSDKSHPSGEYDKLTIRTGHIMVARTDPVRLTLIGVAPMIVGLTIIYFVGNSCLNFIKK